MTATIDTPVLIVGAGPAGLVTAIEIARRGERPLVVERHPSTSIFPRATGVSTRSMEIFRSYGIEDEIRRGGSRVIPRQATVSSLSDPAPVEGPIGFPDDAAALAVSPTTPAVSPQDHVEPILVERLRTLGGEVRFSTELVGFTQDDSGVSAMIRDRSTGTETIVRSRYLVGADGHASTVRSTLGIPMTGPDDLGRFLSILFRADLDPILGERRHGLYMIGVPGGPPTVVVPSGVDDRFVLAIPLPPGMDDAATSAAMPEPALLDMVRTVAGVQDLEVEILATSTFAFSAQVAERWSIRRAFLVGDAAHRMTPRGGRGMNTAIADGYDLGWKLAAVVQGIAGPGLLDTYEGERGPIGRRNVALSMVEGGAGSDDGLAEDLGPLDALPGHRTPHRWLDAAGTCSTLDLVGPGLALFVAGETTAWREASAGLDPRIALRVVAVGTDAARDAYGLTDGGAVLVRPDAVIAARFEALPGDVPAALRGAVDAALCRRGAGDPPAPRVGTQLAARRGARERMSRAISAALGILATAWLPSSVGSWPAPPSVVAMGRSGSVPPAAPSQQPERRDDRRHGADAKGGRHHLQPVAE